MSMLRAALGYAERLGWPVFPLRPRSKSPLVAKADGGNGYLDATTDTEQIHAWWERCPDANIGLAMSEASGLLALDVDPRAGGDEALAELEQQHGALPHTVTQLTGRGDGGLHYLFRRPAGVRFRNVARGLEVKANGYILAAPSLHPDSGQPYRWDLDALPSETPLAELPAWLLAMVLNLAPEADDGEVVGDPEVGVLVLSFKHAGLLLRKLDNGAHSVVCPWQSEHTTGKADDKRDTSTVILPRTTKHATERFWCSHEHCAHRTQTDVLTTLPLEAVMRAQGEVLQAAADDAADTDEERAAIQNEGQE